MARQEHDREDLLREATALVERAEIAVAAFEESVVVGFRASGAASVFFGGDPVYQFNDAGELRRAYRRGRLIKAVGGKLIELERRRADGQVQLLRREMDGAAVVEWMADCRGRLNHLQKCLEAQDFRLVGQVPAGADVIGRIGKWLANLPAETAIAAQPNVAG